MNVNQWQKQILTLGFTLSYFPFIFFLTFYCTCFTFNLFYYSWTYPLKWILVQPTWANGKGGKQSFGRVTLQQKCLNKLYIIISLTKIWWLFAVIFSSWYSLLGCCQKCYFNEFGSFLATHGVHIFHKPFDSLWQQATDVKDCPEKLGQQALVYYIQCKQCPEQSDPSNTNQRTPIP